MNEIFHSNELEIIRYIQEFRGPFLDEFFKFLNYFDRQEFLLVLIPTLWLAFGWKWGLRISYALLLNSVINHALKEYFASPRPYYIDPSLGIIQVGGYGFPSGAAQTAMLLSGILLYSCKSLWKWPVTFIYFTLISFSRIYLGVHFPTDIFAGWIVGIALCLLFIYTCPKIETKLEKLQPSSLFILSQIIPISLFFGGFLHPSMCTYAMGLGVGLYVNYIFKWSLDLPKTTIEYIYRIAIGVAGAFLLYYLLSLLPFTGKLFDRFGKTFILSLWITSGSLLVCQTLGKSGNRHEPIH